MKNSVCIYVHWPWCSSICSYCDYYKFKLKDIKSADLLNCYIRDLCFLDKYLRDKDIISINIGGGTPSIMDIKLLHNLLEYIYTNYSRKKKIEVSIEVNPEDLNKNKLLEYRKMQINRISIGVQSFSDKILKWLNRNHSKEIALDSIFKTSKYFNNVSVDLIYGTPFSNKLIFRKDLMLVRELPTKHISFYEFDLKKNSIKPKYVSDVSFFLERKAMLEEKNFIWYETNSFAAKGFESIYNKSVMSMKNYLGIGPSAHSRIVSNKSCSSIYNTKDIKKWLNPKTYCYSEKKLTKKEMLIEFFLVGFEKTEGVRIVEIESMLKCKLRNYINMENIDVLEKGNFLIQSSGRLSLTIKGKMLLHNVISKLLI